MEQFFKVALWTAAIFGFLQAQCTDDKDAKIEYMRERVKCLSNSTFYGPTNVEVKCIARALECVKEELQGVVHVECEDESTYVDDAVEFMECKIASLGNRPTPSTNSECDCHKWPEVPFLKFLDKMKNLLQLVKTVQ